MLILVSGGASSGKSAFAENLITASPCPRRIYLATMPVRDGEDAARVARHRALRAGKGFETVEAQEALGRIELPAGCAALLEDLPNLTANEQFGPRGPAGAGERVLDGISALERRAGLLAVVTGELFSDGMAYPPETAEYLDLLAGLNRALAARADQVYEIVCGIPVCWKGGGS